MRTFVSPIGFNTTSVTRAILKQDIEAGDLVVLVRPGEETDTDRAADAIADVEKLLHEIEPEISVDVERIPHDDFSSAVIQCSDLLTAADGSVIVNFGGGARDVLVPLIVATIAHGQNIAGILGYSDIDGQVREWEVPTLPTNVSRGAKQTLITVADQGQPVSISSLEERRESAKSTITRHVNQLESEGLVSCHTEDRSKLVEITLSGRLYLASQFP
ncbi:CRISPR-associated CARF protein Csa3 [Halovivax gelatinilyticus]|uniref:CRISPR-associated CARF protein Csa3 n=1 Tax=Halovivax gelatinilyticus TaxID=2961597 RepID=UPI0020CA45AA|nr:CRISPR-associated CARF protein Csa3 [Halovivax gelatinilyticus]